MARYVVLLRGINLGRARQVGMADLRETLTGQGHAGVRTHLRSGNVLLDSDLGEDELVREVEEAVRARFGFDVPVVVRTRDELAAVVAADPFAGVATDPARYTVTFMVRPPEPGRVAALPPAELGAYRVVGRELFLWLPDGIADTPLASWRWDTLLAVPGTTRNWNTVTKLAELAAV
ncbi:DUF1697 domain-containing protein [Geodermatophilus sabuli]|uniref:DUF1697 domain-containing protein n=1 Tax=Geodermatophilus sabuli TaxID=1564158 RepID=A0A7K3W5W0_9ACTN|nr:DUF1697 domain-containing protein [Geodermatophilus sabuli]